MSVFMVTFMWVLPSCLVSKDTQNLTYASKKSYPVWHILPSILPSSDQGFHRCCSTIWNDLHIAWAQASRDLMSPAILLCPAAHTHLCVPHRTTVSQTQLTQPALGGSSCSTMLLDIQDGSLSTVQCVLGGRDWGIPGVCRAESLMEMASSMFSE